MMTQANPILGLGGAFPNELYILKTYTEPPLFMGFEYDGLLGLGAWSTERKAIEFGRPGPKPVFAVAVTFDEAREIAKARPAPLNCLMLLDDPANPIIHYVK